MPTMKPRVTITMNSEQFDKIEEYRFKHRCKNQTQAILSLIEAGFAELETSDEKNSDKSTFSAEIIEMSKKYRKLDSHGKEMVNLVLDKEFDRCENAASAYLMPVAAHNDYADDPDELERMKRDLDNL